MKITAILLMAVLIAAAFTVVVDVDQSADAVKAKKKGVRNHHTHNIGNQVCGDQLCDGSAYVKKTR
jgi:hypothetical protein